MSSQNFAATLLLRNPFDAQIHGAILHSAATQPVLFHSIRSTEKEETIRGTVAPIRLLPGKEQEILVLMDELTDDAPEGYIGESIYRLDSGNNEYIMSCCLQRQGFLHC